MRNKWIPLAVAMALLTASAQTGMAATQDAKAAPAASAVVAQWQPPPGKPPATPKKKQVNLNAASREELKALPGGSDEEAARIIAGRPYNSKADLVTRKIISDGRYGAIKTLVVAGHPAKPAK
jgi:DNA uptake protein ComE-like DNA-binding protein